MLGGKNLVMRESKQKTVCLYLLENSLDWSVSLSRM